MPHLHILFVDDDSDESYLFNEALEQSGAKISLSKANDGNQLITALLYKPLPHLVIMDINMPYKDGIEALEEIRSYPQFDKLPVIIYSTTKNPDSINACYQKGASLFIIKPNNFDGMVKVVKGILETDWKNYNRPARDNFVITGE